MQGQSYNIVEATAYVAYAYAAYPFLYAVGTGFVKRTVLFHIIFYLLDGKCGKCDFGYSLERRVAVSRCYGDTSHHFVCGSRQLVQHFSSFGLAVRLAKHFITAYHHGIGSDNELIR